MYIDKDDLITHFFKVFGIEPIPIKSYGYWLIKGSIAENDKGEKVVYPEITDRKLLELICIQGNIDYFMIDNSGNPISVNGLKNSVLHTLTLLSKNHKELKQQIQQLFKGGE